jgi:mono/diheme cytochrome c family protein
MNSGIFRKVFFSVLFGIVVLAALVFLSLRFAPLPVAVADHTFPFEKQLVKIALRSRIGRETKQPPISVDEHVLESGAQIYRAQCSICHGVPGHDSAFAKQMFPAPPQLWKKHGLHGAVGVSDDAPGFSYWIIANGIRLTGMPSFRHSLSDTEMWQLSLLLKNANKEMPATVTQTLNSPTP